MGSTDKLTSDSEVSKPQKEQVGNQCMVSTQVHQVTQNGEISIDRSTIAEVSKKEEVKTIGESIENGLDDDNKNSGGDSDGDEPPPFNFEFRGKLVGQTAGSGPDAGKKAIRPPKKDLDVKKTQDELEKRKAAADAKKK